jgi:hypothetical protein
VLLVLVAMSPPPPYTIGWVHNLKDAPGTSDASKVIGLAAAFSTIAVLFTILRLSVRYKAVGGWGLDDAAIAASAVGLRAKGSRISHADRKISFSALCTVP